MAPSLNRTKLTAGLRAALAENRGDRYQVLVRLKDDADRDQVAKWCHLARPTRGRSLSLTLELGELAALSHQPWVKAVSLSEDLYSLDR